MKKCAITLLLIFVFVSSAFAGRVDNMETLTVLTSAVNTFTVASIEDVTKQQPNAKSAFCTVAVATINYTFDGTTPTTGATGVGHKAISGSWFVITGHIRLVLFKGIGETATSTVSCTYSFAD